MGVLTVEDVRELARNGDRRRVSLYLPIQPGGAEIGANIPARLKNLLREAESRLEESGAERAEIDDLLAPAQRLLRDDGLWRNPGAGLAAFLDGGDLRTYRLPIDVPERAAVGRRYLLKPLLPLLVGDGRFWVLTLSQNSVRLLEGGMDRIREIDLHSIPQRLQDAVGYDFEQRSLQFHSGPRASGGGTALFHGQGAGVDDQKTEIEKFLRAVDRSLLELLRDKESPLVVAAAEPVLSIYREVSKHPHLTDDAIEGSPDQKSAEQLHAAAWEIVEPGFLRQRREARERYGDMAGTGRASSTLEEIVPAVYDGRVETLFVATDRERWGRYDPESRELEQADAAGPDIEDLLDVAAAEALQRSATVYAVPAARMPADSGAAAIYRY